MITSAGTLHLISSCFHAVWFTITKLVALKTHPLKLITLEDYFSVAVISTAWKISRNKRGDYIFQVLSHSCWY